MSLLSKATNCTVIAWNLGKRMTVELVQRTLNKAIKSQDYPEAVILHYDQGSQYTSLEYEELLKYYGMAHSFSRRGYPYHMPVLNLGMDI